MVRVIFFFAFCGWCGYGFSQGWVCFIDDPQACSDFVQSTEGTCASENTCVFINDLDENGRPFIYLGCPQYAEIVVADPDKLVRQYSINVGPPAGRLGLAFDFVTCAVAFRCNCNELEGGFFGGPCIADMVSDPEFPDFMELFPNPVSDPCPIGVEPESQIPAPSATLPN